MADKKRLFDPEMWYDGDLFRCFGNGIDLVKGVCVWERIIQIADDWGGYDPDPMSISVRMGILGPVITPPDVERYLDGLVAGKKVVPYNVDKDGNELLKTHHWIANLMKHQPYNKFPKLPKWPLAPWIEMRKEMLPSKKEKIIYDVLPDVLKKHSGINGYVQDKKAAKELEREKMSPEEEQVEAIFDYFCSQTGRSLKLNPARRDIIAKRLQEGNSLTDMQTAVDNFIEDEWDGRESFCDIQYCFGVNEKTGADYYEKWLNWKPKSKKKPWEKTADDKPGIKVDE